VRLEEFADQWGQDYPTIVKSWRSNWQRIVPFFEYPPEIRRIIYTTNAIESVNMSLRKVTKSRGSFPSDEALLKLFYLALNNISKKWTMPLRDWKAALTRFTIQFKAGCPRTDPRPVYTKLCTPSPQNSGRFTMAHLLGNPAFILHFSKQR